MKTINDRIIQRAAELGLRQADIAKKTSATKGSVSNWFNHKGKPDRYISELARALKTTEGWLLTGKAPGSAISEPIAAKPDNNAELLPPPKRVPLVSMVAAGDWTECVDPYEVGFGSETLPAPDGCGSNTFAVTVNGESMQPKFEDGEIIFCDPSVPPENGDFVIVKMTDDNTATFKQLVIENGQKMLKALNPDWPNRYIEINGNCHIVGKVIGRYEKF